VTNFTVFSNHVTIVPAIRAILWPPQTCGLTGFQDLATCPQPWDKRPYRFVPATYGKPLVTAGLEPLDILQAIEMLPLQIRQRRCCVDNVFELDFDAELRYSVSDVRIADPNVCQCGEVEGPHQALGIQGVRHRLHLGNTIGTCMVSSDPQAHAAPTTTSAAFIKKWPTA